MNTTRLALLPALLLSLALLIGCKSATDQYMCRARQAEAKATLKALQSSQTAFKAQKGKFASSVADLGFAPPTATKYYDVKIDAASDAAFAATATGKDAASGDVWVIDATGEPRVTLDKCHHE